MKNLFGIRIKELRESKTLSQVELANIFNVTRQTVSAWEKHIQETDFDTLMSIADFFEVSTDYLLGLED